MEKGASVLLHDGYQRIDKRALGAWSSAESGREDAR